MRIVVGLDGSAQANWGLEFVRRLELSGEDEVIVASVAEIPTAILTLPGAPPAGWYERIWEDALAGAREIVEAGVRALDVPARIEPLVVEGHPLPGLRDLADGRDADLVVVGPHGRGRLESLLVGSVSQGLLGSLKRPIVVVRELRNELRTIVLAVDGSEHSRAAVDFLARLPLPKATIACTSVIPTGNPSLGRVWPDDVADQIDADQRDAAEAIVDEAASVLSGAGHTVVRDLRTGEPKEGILAAIREHGADLVVLGARGRGGFEALVLGSVSRAVATSAPCSALVVHRR